MEIWWFFGPPRTSTLVWTIN